jgi:hypothetical protein
MAMLRISRANVATRLVSPNERIADCKIRIERTNEMKTALQRIAQLNNDFAYYHVIGLHGDQMDKRGNYVGNDNGDFFWWRQTLLAKRDDGMNAFETWRGGDVLENHDERANRGYIADVWPVFGNKSIDMLMATNRRLNPLLCRNIDTGKVKDVSMGTIVGHSYCSVKKCHRHASKNDPNITEQDWCHHLKYYKGQRDPDTGEHVYEDNRDIFGVECSWITIGAGADSEAKLQMRVAALSEQQKSGSLKIAHVSIVQMFAARRTHG